MKLKNPLRIAALLLALATATVSTQDTNAGGANLTLVRSTGVFALAQGLINGAPDALDLIVANSAGSVVIVSDGGPSGSGQMTMPEDMTLDLGTSNPELAVGWVRTPRNSGPAQIIASDVSKVVVAGPVTTPEGTPRITFNSSVGGMRFVELAAGDINGDGYDDILVHESNLSRVFVIFGRADLASRDLSATPADVIITDIVTDARLAAGDVTGDGIADLIVGQPSGGPGRVYLIKGRATFPSTTSVTAIADATFAGAVPQGGAGRSVGLADFDGDGLRDIVIGASLGTQSEGRAHIVFGSATLSSRSLDAADVTMMPPAPAATHQFALGLATGDLNRDGFDDVIVRSTQIAFIYYGRPRQFASQLSGYDRVITCCTGSAAGSSALRDALVYDRGGDGRDVTLSNSGGVMFFATDRAGTLSTTTPTITRSLAPGASTVAEVQISNSGAKTGFWSVIVNKDAAGNWITVSPAIRTTAAGSSSSASVTLTGLAPGTYTATLIVIPETQPPQHFIKIPVTVTVQ